MKPQERVGASVVGAASGESSCQTQLVTAFKVAVAEHGPKARLTRRSRASRVGGSSPYSACPPAESSPGAALLSCRHRPHRARTHPRGNGFVLVSVCGVCRLFTEEAARCHSQLVDPFRDVTRVGGLEETPPSVWNWKLLRGGTSSAGSVGAAHKEGNGERKSVCLSEALSAGHLPARWAGAAAGGARPALAGEGVHPPGGRAPV